jgi:hypothetical protein
MNPTRTLLWIGFFVLLLAMTYYSLAFSYYNATSMLCLEWTRDAARAQAIIQQWSATDTSLGTLLPFARRITYLDFIFIPVYTALIQHYSTNRLQQEPSLWLNTLLRFNLLLIVVAALVDVLENVLLLVNLRYFTISYIHTGYISLVKWVLIVWTILVWLLSRVKALSRQ